MEQLLRNLKLKSLGLCLLVTAGNSLADEVTITDVSVRQTAPDTYHFSVTLKHADTGWDHYANRWEVVGEDGTLFGTRVLHHPHVNEQPFTRSLSNVAIPSEVSKVLIRAYDSQHGLSPQEFPVTLSK